MRKEKKRYKPQESLLKEIFFLRGQLGVQQLLWAEKLLLKMNRKLER